MNTHIPRMLCLWILIMFCGCGSQQKVNDTAADGKTAALPAEGAAVSAGYCRVIATVTAIDTAQHTGDGSDPCAKAPCEAVLLVEEILGTGAGFHPPLVAGNTIPVKFAYSTAPSSMAAPDLANPLPGVQAGARIRVDIAGRQPGMGGSPGRGYTVYQYTLIKD